MILTDIVNKRFYNTLTVLLRFVWHINLPIIIRYIILNIYCWVFNVKKNDMVKPLMSYSTMNLFFTRDVKKRKIAETKYIIPCDGKIQQFGKLTTDIIYPCKGNNFNLKELFDDDCENCKLINKNLYYCVFYLAPGDYHKFHSPCDMEISEIRKINGNVKRVNKKSFNKYGYVLYEENKRVLIEGKDTDGNMIYYFAVSATNVSDMVIYHQEKANVEKAELLGEFNLGSTIILIFEFNGNFEWSEEIVENNTVRYGDALSAEKNKA